MAANTSLLVAIMVYVGWIYDRAYYGYFNISPLLNAGVLDYMLHSVSVVSPGLIAVVGSVVLTLVIIVRFVGAGLPKTLQGASQSSWIGRLIFKVEPPPLPIVGRRSPAPPRVQVRHGVLVLIGVLSTAIGIYVYLINQPQIGSPLGIHLYLLVILLGGGPLLATWATRTGRHGRFLYAVAIALAAVCVIWAISISAYGLGHAKAVRFANNLPAQTAVSVYSVQPLALSGPGVTVQRLAGGFTFHYRYTGLRLLTRNSGTYFLLPSAWNANLSIAYVIDQTDQTRIELINSFPIRDNLGC